MRIDVSENGVGGKMRADGSVDNNASFQFKSVLSSGLRGRRPRIEVTGGRVQERDGLCCQQ